MLAHDDHTEATHLEEIISWVGLILVGIAVLVRFTLSKIADDSDEVGSSSDSN